MNWLAGLLAFILFWVPMMIIYVILRQRDREIEQEYEDRMKQIKKRYGIE